MIHSNGVIVMPWFFCNMCRYYMLARYVVQNALHEAF